jgi:hypothetical protein
MEGLINGVKCSLWVNDHSIVLAEVRANASELSTSNIGSRLEA